MHMVESNIRGVKRIKNFIPSKIFSLFNAYETINEPKKILPESPMNIFDGYQFNIMNANREPIIIKKLLSPFIYIKNEATIKHPLTRPSIPSIKLIRLIMPVPKNIIKKSMK